MMRKTQYATFILVALCIVSGLLVAGHDGIDGQINGGKDARDLVCGNVWHSSDGLAKIYDGETWVCGNITAYCIEEYEDGIVDPAIGNATNHETGSSYSEGYDYFRFVPTWDEYELNKLHIAVGETRVNETNYVFVTSFTYATVSGDRRGNCAPTEWEPIPTPTEYLSGNTWINISILKFTNPVISALGSGTPNANNTAGFAIYRDNIYIGTTTSENQTNCFFNDTSLPGKIYTAQNYSVAPIARGNYSISAPELSVSIESPKGGECWTGNATKSISYTLDGGAFPCNVNISYSTDSGNTFDEWINTTSKNTGGAHTYSWHLPTFQGDANRVRIRISVTDGVGRVCSAISAQDFTIDCTLPFVIAALPLDQAEDVSVFDYIDIEFSEAMNKASVQSAFSIDPSITNPSWDWISDTRARITHDEFAPATTYTCSIAVNMAKDLSEPGNYLAAYSWDFRTTSAISVSLHFPYTGAILTGNVSQEIRYEVGGGIAPYKVKIDFSNDGGSSWTEIANLSNIPAGTNTSSWALSKIDTSNAKLRITVTETATQPRTKTVISEYFSIDSTKPEIADWSGSTGVIRTTEPIRVRFCERMNKTSVEQGFSLKVSATGTIVNWTASWEDSDKTVIFTPDQALAPNTNYTATISSAAKDKSVPGNAITAKTWNFTAVDGLGVISVSVSFIPVEPTKGDKITISVTVSNTGTQAFGYSATIIIKLYLRKDVTWDLVQTDSISNMVANGTQVTKSFEVTLEDIGTYEYMVEVHSMSTQDIVDGESGKTARQVLSISVTEKKEIGLGPYALIALMVLLVIVIGFLVMAGYKKEPEKKEKPAEEEKKEEEEEEKKSE